MNKAIRIKLTKNGESRKEFNHDPILFKKSDEYSVLSKIKDNLPKVNRKEAIKRGLKYYWTGKLCKKGHLSFRYISSSHCVICVNRKIPLFLAKRY